MSKDTLHQAIGTEAVIPKSRDALYEDELLILNPNSLKEEFRFEEFQYFFARAGFGCDPAKLGTKVFGEFLYDGEETSFRRSDFLGIARKDRLPDWAKEKLQQFAAGAETPLKTQDVSM